MKIKDPLGKIGMFILIFCILLALSSFIAPWKVNEFDPVIFGVTSPRFTHFLGTDMLGRDIFSRLLMGIRNAFVTGIIAAVSSVFIGTALGLISGYYGGIADMLIMRTVDIIYCLPFIPLLLVISSIFGGLSTWNVIILIVILSWAGTARIIRAQTLSLKSREYVEAAKSYSASGGRIIFRHLLPSVLPLAIVYVCFGINRVVFLIAALAYIGLGDPIGVSLGMMIKNCIQSGYLFTSPWWSLPPGIALSLICLGFYLVGRAVSDDRANPRLRKCQG